MKVVFLVGSGSAGKSSLCKELVETYKWNSNSVDEVWGKILLEHSAKINPLILNELKKQNLIPKLQTHMTETEVVNLASIGLLNISIGEHKLTQQFQDQKLDGLEEALKKAGFNESEILTLSHDLRLATQIADNVFKENPFPNYSSLIERLYDETFKTSNADKTIILDVVPDREGAVSELVERFEVRANQYREENSSETLTTSLVFAYCPLQKLDERLVERNRKAKIDNPTDQREGLIAANHLAALVTAEKKFDSSSKNILSRTELFDFINRHANTEKTEDSLFIENPVDPEALQPFHGELVKTNITESGAVKLQLDDDVPTLNSSERPRIGTKETIEKYTKLAEKFGFFENHEQASLTLHEGLSFDVVINTANGTPKSLATELVEKLEKNKTSTHISKL